MIHPTNYFVTFTKEYWGTQCGLEPFRVYPVSRTNLCEFVVVHNDQRFFFSNSLMAGLAFWCDESGAPLHTEPRWTPPENVKPACPVLMPPEKNQPSPVKTMLTIKIEKHPDGLFRPVVEPKQMPKDRGDAARMLLLLEDLVTNAKRNFIIKES